MKITSFIKKYKEKKPHQIISDVIFVLLIIALLIPGSRMFLMSNLQRLIAISPKKIEAENQVKIPKSAYSWQIQSITGEQKTFQDFSNKVILLNFWATWCPPCVAEMPSIQSLYDKYGDRIAFILITNDDPKTVKAFMKEKAYNLPIYYNLSAVPEVFSSRSIPRTMIISKQGKIVFDKTGAAKWDSESFIKKLNELIND